MKLTIPSKKKKKQRSWVKIAEYNMSLYEIGSPAYKYWKKKEKRGGYETFNVTRDIVSLCVVGAFFVDRTWK